MFAKIADTKIGSSELDTMLKSLLNKEYKRVGPLWQGRFKNSFVYDDIYLAILLRYIEQNPIKANMIDSVGKYRWSSSFCILNNLYDDLLSGSMLYNKVLFTSLNKKISDIELEKLDKLEKTKYKQDKNLVRLKQQPLGFYFNAKQNIKIRNIKIKEAVFDGYKQSEIADFLKLSRTTVSKIIKSE
jgi:DNA-binding CsgD family transcriptional regulator